MEQDYVKILQTVISESSDENLKILNRLLDSFEQSEKNADIAKCIYQSIDDMTEALADIYIHFIENKMDVSWFYFAKTIMEERDNAADYFEVLKSIVPGKMSLEKVEEFFNQDNGDCESFRRIVDKYNVFKPYCQKSELPNSEDENAFMRSQRELENIRCELMDVRTELFHKNIRNTELEEEFFSLRKEMETLKNKLFILNKQLVNKDQQFSMITNINTMLTRENAELEKTIADLKQKNEEPAEEIQRLNDIIREKEHGYVAKIDELNFVISDLENQISNLQNEKDYLEKMQSETAVEDKADITDKQDLDDDMADELVMSDNIEEPSINEIASIFIEPEELDFPVPAAERFDNIEPSKAESIEEINNSIFEDVSVTEDDLIEIKDNHEAVKKEGSIFHHFTGRLASIAFNRIDATEQNSKMFSMMMSNKFSKEQISIVRELLEKSKNNKRISRYDIYLLVKKNASLEELQSFYKRVA